MYIANSAQKQDLTEHLIATSYVAEYLARTLTTDGVLIEAARVAGLTHDIGKACPSWQACLGLPRVNTDDLDEDAAAGQSRVWPYHQEVSWAYLVYCSDTLYKGRADSWEVMRLVEHAVYWHHAQPTYPLGSKSWYDNKNSKALLEKLSPEDKLAIASFLEALPGLPPVRVDYRNRDGSAPSLYVVENVNPSSADQNARTTLVRGCLISADRYISQLTSLQVAEIVAAGSSASLPPYVLRRFSLAVNYPTKPLEAPQAYSTARFNAQLECAQAMLSLMTVVAHAPAGFGKTLLAVLFNLLRGKRTYWVCPRNEVARSVYTSVIKELAALGFPNVSVELFYTGKRQSAHNCGPVDAFRADIVVTNLDNFLKPVASNDVADRMYMIMAGDVVFDEFHEFVSDSPLYAAFITMMRLRNLIATDARTILLSATPGLHHELWSTMAKDTRHLPSPTTHYPAAHGQLYNVSITGNRPQVIAPGSVLITNAVKSAQSFYKEGKADRLVHSFFTPQDRKQLMDCIMQDFGKGGSHQHRVVSSPVLQAAMDISFTGGCDTVLSVDDTMQRLGRINRWGTYGDGVPFLIYEAPKSDRSEMAAVRVQADELVRIEWVKHLTAFLGRGRQVTLDELYAEYNAFHSEGAAGNRAVSDYNGRMYEDGVKGLSKSIFPRKIVGNPAKSTAKKKVVSSASLRSPAGSYFYAVTDQNGQWVKELFSADAREIAELIQDMKYDDTRWARAVSAISSTHAGFLDLPKSARQVKPSDKELMELARCMETPFPVHGGYVYYAQQNAGLRAQGDMSTGLEKS